MIRKHLLPILVWTVLWGLFFATLLLAFERLPTGDFSGQFHAFGSFQAREMAAGRLPIWSPGSYGGIPFAADTQAAVFYPIRWLTILLSLFNGFSYYLLELEGLFHIWLAGVFTYFLVFDIGRDRAVESEGNGSAHLLARLAPEQWAGLIAAVAFGLGGYLTSYPLLQLAVLESIIWLPLILILLRRGVRPHDPQASSVPALVGAGIALGISALAGHPQTFLHVAYLSAAYYLFLTWQARWRWSWILGLGLLIGVLAVGTAAPAILPAARFLPLTVRGDVSYEFVSRGFPLLHAVQVLLPGYLSQWLPQYIGLGSIFLAILAWLGRDHWQLAGNKRETYFWVAVIMLAAWLALGDKGILYELFYTGVPGFALFRQQERLVSLFVLGTAVLAGQGFVIWAGAGAGQRRSWLGRSGMILAALLLLVGVIELFSRSALGKHDWFLMWVRQWLILASITAVLWPFKDKIEPKQDQWRVIAFTVLLALDLFFPVRRAMNLTPETPTVFWPQPAWLDDLEPYGIYRVDSQRLFHANLGELHGLEDIKGISPLKPQLTADFEDLPRSLRWQLLNVKYVLAEKQLEEGLTQVREIKESIFPGQAANAFVYRFENALPRAWMVYDALWAADEGEAFDRLRAPGFDPAASVILTVPEAGDLKDAVKPQEPALMEIEQLSTGQMMISVDTETDGFLVISEWSLPGWRASLDGEATPLLRADYGLQAVFVPAGKHVVHLTYANPEVYLGLVLCLVTLLLALVLAWRWRPLIATRPAAVSEARPVKRVRDQFWRDSLSGSRSRWLMVLVTLLGFGLRIFLLGSQELRGDEAFSYLYSRLPLAEVIPALIREGDPHSPFHYLLLNIWMNLTGISELAMRMLSLLPGVLAIPVLYQLGREMVGRRLGVIAAFLMAIAPSLIWLSQDVRNQYTWAILLTSLATWLLVRLSQAGAGRSKVKAIGLWILYAVLAATAIYSHYYAVFALLAHGLFLWFAPDRRRSLWPWMASGLLAALLFLPWIVVSLSDLLQAGQLSDPSTPDLAQYLVKVGRELIVGGTLPGRWVRWLVLGSSLLAVYGFIVVRRKKPGWAAMLMGWLVSALLFIYLIQFSRGTFNAFYISVAAPAWILLLAAGLLALWQQAGWRRAIVIVVLTGLLAATTASLRNAYFDPLLSRTLGYRQVADFLQDQAAEGDVFIAHFPDPSLDYYLRDVPLPREMVPAKAGETADQTESSLAELASKYHRLWLVPYNKSAWDPENVVPQWLSHNLLQEQRATLQRMELDSFRSPQSMAEILLPVMGELGDELRLDGAYVTVDGRPIDASQAPMVEAGAEIETSLIWSAGAGTAANYTVFVHLLDENGLLAAQHDGVPVEGTRPMPTWQKGEQILDRHVLVVPEGVQGNGKLVVGLYDADTLQRQELLPGQDALQILEIQFNSSSS